MSPLENAITLEALYQMVRAKGFRRNRTEFIEWGTEIIAAMRARGELPEVDTDV